MTSAREAIARVDHLVWAAPDLDAGIDAIEALLGVRATHGGSHPGLGTRNALLALGSRCYLEIVAPDPGQADYRTPRWFGIDELDAPRLVTWAAAAAPLERWAGRDLGEGRRLGAVKAGRRRTADGTALAWRFTDPFTVIADGVVPFLIDWGDSPHPAAGAPAGARLADLRIEHPAPASVRRTLDALGLDVAVAEGTPAVVAVIDGPNGRVELR